MTKPLSLLLAGILIGVVAMLIADSVDSPESGSQVPVRDIVETPAMSAATAETHREERYRRLSSIAEIMALPSEFARAEALYTLSGRSGSAAVQALVFEADRIADDVERVSLQGILFSRLTEIDPQSALALARTDQFAAVKALERAVWSAWAREDLDDALFAAKAQISIVDQKFAAQSLYVAFGYMGNEITDRIEAELGIEPDRSTRAGFLYRLADKSPAEAIAYINELDDPTQQRKYVSWLANYLSLSSPERALRFAPLFDDAAYTKYFERIVTNNLASENPRDTIERLIASGSNLRRDDEFYTAMRALAQSDAEAAKLYFSQIRSVEAKRRVGSAIAVEMARRDPEAALEWARENEDDEYPMLQLSVFRVMAAEDPQRAMQEVLALPNSEMKSRLVAQVIGKISEERPLEAVAFLDEIQNAQQKLQATQRLLHTWISRDADAAVEWVLGQDDEIVADLMDVLQHDLVENDIDSAIRILPRLGPAERDRLKLQIAQRLTTRASPAEAQNFIRQFEGEPGYDQLQAAVIGGIAKNDSYAAIQLAAQLPAGGARDRAYTTIIEEHAQANPSEAVRWLQSIDDLQFRGMAAGQIATAWEASDPAAASRWLSSLPAGLVRDSAISGASNHWRNPTTQQQALIDSIDDRGIRGRAKLMQVYRAMRTDPDRARELMDDPDIPPHERQRLETMLIRYGSGI